MYYLYNIIPLLFGNKQTIEFRIHTPTYEVNKILPFIFMNSLIVNFTIRNQNLILKNKNFLKNYNIFDILCNQIEKYDISNKNIFNDLMYDYIEKRKNYCERQILKGNILGNESEIPVSNYIDWLNNDKKLKKSLSDLKNKSYIYTEFDKVITKSYKTLRDGGIKTIVDYNDFIIPDWKEFSTSYGRDVISQIKAVPKEEVQSKKSSHDLPF